MLFSSEYYIKNQTERLVYNNDSGELVLDRLLDNLPCFANTNIDTTETSNKKKTIIINTWLERHLNSSLIADLIREGFSIYQVDDPELKPIKSEKDITLSPKVVFSSKQLYKIFNEHKPKITQANAFVLDYYQCEKQERNKYFSNTNASSLLTLSFADIAAPLSMEQMVLLISKPQGINLVIDLHTDELSKKQLELLLSHKNVKKITLVDKSASADKKGIQVRSNNLSMIRKWDEAIRRKIALNNPGEDLLDLIPSNPNKNSSSSHIEAATIRFEKDISQDSSCPYLKAVSVDGLKTTVKLDTLLKKFPNIETLLLEHSTFGGNDNVVELPHLSGIQLSILTLPENSVLTLLSKKKNLRYLAMNFCVLTQASKISISFDAIHLKAIDFSNSTVSADFLAGLLGQSKELEALQLHNIKIEGALSEKNLQLPKLTSLSFSSLPETASSVLQQLFNASPITHLSTDMKGLNGLRNLNLTAPLSLTHITLNHLDDLDEVDDLDEATIFSVFQFLKKQEKLHVLDLSELIFLNNEMVSKIVKAIKQFQESAKKCQVILPRRISSKNYRDLSEVTKNFDFVQELTIEGPISNEDFVSLLDKCPNLQTLTLHNVALPNEVVKSYSALKQLKTLNVHQDKDKQISPLINDKNWRNLLGPKHLTFISIQACMSALALDQWSDAFNDYIDVEIDKSSIMGGTNKSAVEKFDKKNHFGRSLLLTSSQATPLTGSIPPTLSDGEQPGPQFNPLQPNEDSDLSKEAWSMSMLIYQLNQFLLLSHPNDRDYLQLTKNFKKGICVAVSTFYAETLVASKNLNEGIAQWSILLSTLRSWSGNTLPDKNSSEATYLNQLWSFVEQYYVSKKDSPYKTLISSLEDFLALTPFPSFPLYLGNYDHRCTLLFKDNTWVFFDPNYKHGQAQTYSENDKQKLIETIHYSLGHGLAVSSDESFTLPFNTHPTHFNVFVSEGGLFHLFQNQHHFEQYRNNIDINNLLETASECLFFEKQDRPCWFYGISRGYSSAFTINLLKEYHRLKPTECLDRLSRDIKKFKEADYALLKKWGEMFPENHAIRCLFLTALPDNTKETVVPLPEVETISGKKLDIVLNHFNTRDLATVEFLQIKPSHLSICLEAHSFIPPSIDLAKHNVFLRNTIATKAAPSDLTAFDWHALSSEKHENKNRLLKFTQQETLNHYLHHLQSYLKDNQPHYFVVNSFRELKCAVRSLHISDDNTCAILPSPSGAFFDFLKSTERKPPTIVVNWSNFSAKEIVQSNTLLDDMRNMDGVPVPENAIIVGLQNVSDPSAYRQNDFISRQVEIDVPETLVVPAVEWPKLSEPSQKKTQCHEIVIDFYNDLNWQPYFYGQLLLDKSAIQFSPSPLLLALRNFNSSENNSLKITFKNVPSHIPELGYAINSLISERECSYRGEVFKLPQQVHLSCEQTGYTLKAKVQSGKHRLVRSSFQEYDAVLNPTSLSRCFVQYRYDKHTLTTLDGLIKKQANKVLKLYLTRNLSEGMWAKLLDEAERNHCQLNISVAPNVSLPDDLKSILAINTDANASAITQVETFFQDVVHRVTHLSDPPAQLIISNDLRLSEKNLHLEPDNTLIVDLSELIKSDLFYQLTREYQGEELIFNEKISDIWSGLRSGKTVVLKGKCSPELADELALLFRTNGGIYHNGEIENFTGKLYIITSDAELFHCIPQKKTDHYTLEERIKDFSSEFKAYANQHAAALQNFTYNQLDVLSKTTPYLTDPSTLCSALNQLPTVIAEPIARDAMDLSENAANHFFDERKNALCNSLEKEKMVFLSGETGVGKSSFIQALKDKHSNKYQISFGNIAEWASANDPSKEQWLFIDEANLENTQWSIFETLFSNPPQILYDGVRHVLTPQHKIIFAGNPANYGGERILPALFSDHPNVVTFNEMSHAYLFNELLKPILGTITETEDIARCFLRVFDYVKSVDKEAISARELKTMALLWKAKINENPMLDKIKLAHYCAYTIGRNTLKKDQQIILDSWFKTEFGSEPSIERSYPETLKPFRLTKNPTDAFHLTKNHYPTYDKLEDLMVMRSQPQKGGLCGLVLEGAPGNGKSHFIKAYLLSKDFSEIKLHAKEHADLNINAIKKNNQHFYYLPATLSVREKTYYLRRAFHEGAIVVMDELNAGTMLERLVNSLLMGEDIDTSPAKHPGFLLLGTQNPSSMPGREETSLAIQRRVMHSEFPEYSAIEIHQILCDLGFSQSKAYSVVAQFIQAKKVNSELTFRELIRFANTLKDHSCHQQNEAIQLPAPFWQSLNILSQSHELQASDTFVLRAINEIGFHHLMEYHEETASFHFKTSLSDGKNLSLQEKALGEYTQEELRRIFYHILVNKNYAIPSEMPEYTDIIRKDEIIHLQEEQQAEINGMVTVEALYNKIKTLLENNPNDIDNLLSKNIINKVFKAEDKHHETTLLLFAAIKKDDILVDMLIKKGAQVPLFCGYTIADVHQKKEKCLVKALLTIVNSEYQHLPLHTACENLDVEFAELLINHKADVNRLDCYTNSPLDRALSFDNLNLNCTLEKKKNTKKIVELLIRNGAKITHANQEKIEELFWYHISPKKTGPHFETTAVDFFKPNNLSQNEETSLDDDLQITSNELIELLKEYDTNRTEGVWKKLGFDGSKTIKNLRLLIKNNGTEGNNTITFRQIREAIHRKDLSLKERNGTNYILGLISARFKIKSYQREQNNPTNDVYIP